MQLPEHTEAQRRFILSIEPLGIDPVNGQLATINGDLQAANDEDQPPEPKPPTKAKALEANQQEPSFIDRIAEYF